MAKFAYRGDESRYYPSLGLTAEPGVVVDLPEMPTDGRWEEATSKAKAAPPAKPTNS